jgi:hypothetical protein
MYDAMSKESVGSSAPGYWRNKDMRRLLGTQCPHPGCGALAIGHNHPSCEHFQKFKPTVNSEPQPQPVSLSSRSFDGE